MVTQSNFEVTVLSPQQSNWGGISTTIWQPIIEYDPPYSNPTDQDPSVVSQKYIGIAAVIDLEQQHHYEFAVDFKVHCGFTFIDGDEAEYIVFRTYLDNIKIGSAFIKRERWERSGTYRVRKKGRRYWVDELQGWVQKPWEFDSGLHGTLKIEVWRESGRPASSGSWDHPDFFGEGNIYDSGNAVTLSEFDGGLPKLPRVRHTKKVDMWPMATFLYEYRSEGAFMHVAEDALTFADTLKILGMGKQPETAPKPTIDLTEADDEQSMAGPSSALTSTNESDGFWSHNSSSNATSDPMDDVTDQYMHSGFKNQELDDMASATGTSWNFSSCMSGEIGYQAIPGYHEEPYACAEVPVAMSGAYLQERDGNESRGKKIEIVDLTMLD
ncbi:hypothetical protein LTR70_009078 [Exophiala xenobiotica]|uniref:Uncharacterized protein n=1 Tax=Lithohypha guttulata TaxID=1690604 RepID=A0ABR0JV78_9EURO|nr:hypothetical protein LTR24_010035 [Lithohypha guttulata]KAK5310998.1 hypothetical protein LTR70_009078 [Exophiala xenobiotica]